MRNSAFCRTSPDAALVIAAVAYEQPLHLTFEVVPHGVGVDQRGIGDVRRGSTLTQQDHGIDAAGLAQVPRGTVDGTQLAGFMLMLTESVVTHPQMISRFRRWLPG